MVGWHHHGHELGQTPGDSEGQGSLARCSPCSCKESDTTVTEQQHQGLPNTQPSLSVKNKARGTSHDPEFGP